MDSKIPNLAEAMVMELTIVEDVGVAREVTIPDQKVVSGTHHWIDKEN